MCLSGRFPALWIYGTGGQKVILEIVFQWTSHV